MFNQGSGYSLSDVAAVTGGNRNDGMFGDGAWWIIILFLFVFCGWGNGNGFGNGSSGGALTRGELCQDMNFQGVENGIRGIQQGLCDGFYAMNTGMLNGFSGTQNTLAQGFYGLNTEIMQGTNAIQQSINSDMVANMQNTNALTAQLNTMAAANQACCCETQRQVERGFCDINYNLASQECQTRQAIADAARDIIENQNCNTRSVMDFLTQDKISTLQNEVQQLRTAASNQYLINELSPKAPIPAFNVPNPFVSTGYANNCCCCN